MVKQLYLLLKYVLLVYRRTYYKGNGISVVVNGAKIERKKLNKQTNRLHFYRRLLKDCLHGKTAKLCLADS